MNDERQNATMSFNGASCLAAALEHHRAGRLIEAEKSYRSLLIQNPDDADTLHLLGMLLHAKGKSDDAELLIHHAISITASQAVFHSNLGIVLAARGKPAEAIAAYRVADSLKPNSPENLNKSGCRAACNRGGCRRDRLLQTRGYPSA